MTTYTNDFRQLDADVMLQTFRGSGSHEIELGGLPRDSRFGLTMGSPSKLGFVFVFAFHIVGHCTAAVDQAPLFPRHHYSQLLARISLTLYHAPYRTSKARKIDSNSTILVHGQSDLVIPCGAGC